MPAAIPALSRLGVGRRADAEGRYPEPTHGDYLIRGFKFKSSETLHELRLR